MKRGGYTVLRNRGAFEVDDRRGEQVKFACCECSLVHRIAFAREGTGRLGVAVAVDRAETSRLRRLCPLQTPRRGWRGRRRLRVTYG